jgi:hypothetical protein
MQLVDSKQLGARGVRVIDAALVFWIVLWIGLGVFAGHDIADLGSLSDTLVKTGGTVTNTGDALDLLRGVPFVGAGVGKFVDDIRAAGASIQESGRQSRGTIGHLSWLIGLTLGVLPPLLMIVLYVPVRLAWRRDRRAIAVGLAHDDPAFEEYLARRAIDNVPYDRLRLVTADPWRDLAAGELGPLADLELARLGLRRAGARP